MRRREFIIGLSAAATQSNVGSTQPVKTRPLVAVLLSSALGQSSLDHFKKGMTELGCE